MSSPPGAVAGVVGIRLAQSPGCPTQLILVLKRQTGDHAMNKVTMKPAYVAGETKLFDKWFDAIEDGVRGRVRGFIETMLEEELDGALSRPRYGRRKPDEGDNEPGVAGHRHGHRRRTLTGTFGKIGIDVPRARLACADGKTGEWKGTVTLTGLRHEGVFSDPAGHAASITQEISCHATIAAARSVR